MIEVSRLIKNYAGPNGEVVPVLNLESFVVGTTEQLALAGPSGSGKTTFLHILAGLILPTSGSVALDGLEITTLSEARRELFRAQHIGYVFQNVNLLESLTVVENVTIAAYFGRRSRGAESVRRAEVLLERVGLSHRLRNYPHQLSRGEQQRVAIARALVNGAELILADEPTASLDQASRRMAVDLLREICREARATLIISSHDPEVLADFDEVYLLKNGTLQREGKTDVMAPGVA